MSPLSCWSQHSPGSPWSPWSPWLHEALLFLTCLFAPLNTAITALKRQVSESLLLFKCWMWLCGQKRIKRKWNFFETTEICDSAVKRECFLGRIPLVCGQVVKTDTIPEIDAWEQTFRLVKFDHFKTQRIWSLPLLIRFIDMIPPSLRYQDSNRREGNQTQSCLCR